MQNVLYKHPSEICNVHSLEGLLKKNMSLEESNQYEDEKKQRSPPGRASEELQTLQL